MPIVDGPDDEEIVEKPNLVISEVPLETPVAETKRRDLEGLASFASGQKWAVDYYRQSQGRDSAPASFQDDLPAPYGQYRLVKGFELIVTNPLSQDQNNSETGGFALLGSSGVYSVITPDNGDMFIADVGNGRRVIFQVNEPKRGSIHPEALTTIDYRGMRFVDAAFVDKLNKNRVVETLFFLRENFRNGVKCLLTREEVDSNRRLVNARRRLIALYFRTFFDDNKQTFVLPYQKLLTYDPNVTKFMKAILDTAEHPQVAWITELGVGADVYSNQWTLFDALARKDAELLYSCSRLMAISPIQQYRAKPHFASIYYSGVKQVISAADPAYSVNNNYMPPHATTQIQKAGVRQTDMRSIVPQLDLSGQEPMPDYGSYIHRVKIDDYYVFSKAFYDDEPGQSNLEAMTLARLRGQPIDLNLLADIADYAQKFDNLEMFYYIPVILTLIKLAPGVY